MKSLILGLLIVSGYLLNLVVNYIVARIVFQNHHIQLSQVGSFELLHNFMNFIMGFFLGYFGFTFDMTKTLNVLVYVMITIIWLVMSILMIRYIVGLKRAHEIGTFLAVDTSVDYSLGTIFGLLGVSVGIFSLAVKGFELVTSPETTLTVPAGIFGALSSFIISIMFTKLQGEPVQLYEEDYA